MNLFLATNAKRQIARILRKVCKGETVIVTSRGKSVVKIVPAGRPSKREEALARLLARLDTEPVLHLPRISRSKMHENRS